MFLRSFVFVVTLFSSVVAQAQPAQIVIIRHGEKPATGSQLTPQGCERAYLLPGFFADDSVINAFGTPAAIFATKPAGSVREVQTIAPTAAALNLIINDKFGASAYQGIVKAINGNPNYNGRTVLLAWEHHAIPGLAQAFGAALDANSQAWPDSVFDEAWILTFANGGVSMLILPEFVLPTDNPAGGTQWANGNPLNNGPAVPADVANLCANNDALNSLLMPIVKPKVSPAAF